MRHNDVAGSFEGTHYMNKAPIAVITFCLSVAAAAPALAALGGDAASVEADRAHVAGVVQKSASAGLFQLHEITTSVGTIREYLTPSGQVFAVAWTTKLSPDLQQLLGDRYAKYQEALTAQHPRPRQANVQLPDLEVHAGGHMRTFVGRAWLPDLIPAGVSPNDIR